MNTEKEKMTGVVFFAAIISSATAFINKYPFVYSDTGTYIYSGFNGLVFDDRSIFYGLFLRHISLASSLWYVIFAQALIICYLIRITIGMFYSGLRRDYIFITLITFLSLTTGFSFTAGILIPDIFSAASILSLINLLLNKELNKLNRTLVSLLFIFSICTQFSSLAIMLLLFFVISMFLIYKKIRARPMPMPLSNFFLSLSLLLSCLILIPATHFAFSNEFKLSGSTHVFIMNHFVETGILEDYLEEECDHNQYKICEYKDKLGWDFIWSPESALQKTGGWKVNEKEYNLIILDIVTTPKYFILLTQKSVEYSLKQFFTYNIEVPEPQLHSSPPFGQIHWRFKDSVREHLSSLQSGSKWKLETINSIQNVIILLSVVFLFVIVLTPSLLKKLNEKLRWLIILVLLHNIINSFVCSNLSTIDSRFQSRIVWLLPFCAIITLMEFVDFASYFERIKKK